MTKRLSRVLGFLGFLLVTTPVQAEPPIQEQNSELPQLLIWKLIPHPQRADAEQWSTLSASDINTLQIDNTNLFNPLQAELNLSPQTELPIATNIFLVQPTETNQEQELGLPSLLIWKLMTSSQIADAANWSAGNLETLQIDTNSLSAFQVVLNPPKSSEAKIEENVFLSQSELRRNRNYRWNVFEELTLGVGVVDGKPIPVELEKLSRREADVFWQPTAFHGSRPENYDWRVNLNFQPSSQLGINFNGNYLSSQFGINWRPIPGLTFTGSRHNQSETFTGGVQISQNSENLGFSAIANLDTEERWRWGVSSNLGDLQLSYQSNGDPNTLGTNSQVGYSLSEGDRSGSAHLLKVGYETRDTEGSDDRLTTFGWRYQSNNTGGWEFDFSYGIGSQGEGLITSVSAPLSPDLVLRARYQGVSLTSDSDTFKLELLPFSN
jgi:hypothetical protein